MRFSKLSAYEKFFLVTFCIGTILPSVLSVIVWIIGYREDVAWKVPEASVIGIAQIIPLILGLSWLGPYISKVKLEKHDKEAARLSLTSLTLVEFTLFINLIFPIWQISYWQLFPIGTLVAIGLFVGLEVTLKTNFDYSGEESDTPVKTIRKKKRSGFYYLISILLTVASCVAFYILAIARFLWN